MVASNMKYYFTLMIFVCLFGLSACDKTEPPAAGVIDSTVDVVSIGSTKEQVAADPNGYLLVSDSDKEESAKNSLQRGLEIQKALKADILVKYKTIEWIALIPQKELDALENPPEYLSKIEDGSIDDKIDSNLKSRIKADMNDPYQQALVSKNIILEMDNEFIRLPGFIVPLEFGEDDTHVTQFLFVPFFGACIHLPPPPPNQIIYVQHIDGITLHDMYRPYWISGKLKTTLIENDIATSAYSVELDYIEFYEEEYQ